MLLYGTLYGDGFSNSMSNNVFCKDFDIENKVLLVSMEISILPSESSILPDAVSMQCATLKSLTFIKKGRTAITYLSNNKGVLNLHEPPLTKTCTKIVQFLK